MNSSSPSPDVFETPEILKTPEVPSASQPINAPEALEAPESPSASVAADPPDSPLEEPQRSGLFGTYRNVIIPIYKERVKLKGGKTVIKYRFPNVAGRSP